jgi:hypothetical protein
LEFTGRTVRQEEENENNLLESVGDRKCHAERKV